MTLSRNHGPLPFCIEILLGIETLFESLDGHFTRLKCSFQCFDTIEIPEESEECHFAEMRAMRVAFKLISKTIFSRI